MDTRPQAAAAHRQAHWPVMVDAPGREDLVYIYIAVRATGLPNAMSTRIQVRSKLNIAAWERHLSELGGRDRVLDFVKYGFPTGYVGPVSDTADIPNHPSKSDFPAPVNECIVQEIQLEGLVGPSVNPVFAPWVHCSPLMSREKGDTGKRCIITDMPYPSELSLNAL